MEFLFGELVRSPFVRVEEDVETAHDPLPCVAELRSREHLLNIVEDENEVLE